jgi:predicted ATPase
VARSGVGRRSAAARPPHPATSLVGREADAAAVVALLRARGVRLVTLTGPGGVGKTRLALRVAELAADDPGEVGFVPLAAVADPGLVAATVADGLGVSEVGGRSAGDAVAAAIGDRALLLVLDNLEHLLPAVGLIPELLAACPRLRVLATSRAPLRLAAERCCPVAPLPLPAAGADPADLARNPS